MSAFVFLTVMTAFRVLSRNRLRAGLTMLGIVIGVGAVIAMVSIGQGARAAVQAQVASMGTNVIIIMPGTTTVSGVRGSQGGAVTLTTADGLDLKKRIPLLTDTGWAKRDVMQIVNGNRNWNGPVNGVSASYFTIRDWSFSGGGPFTLADAESGARVALIGQTTLENLFDPGEEPVGATIRIKNVPFQIIGVLAPKGQSAQGTDQDDIIFIPFSTAERTRQSVSGISRSPVRLHRTDRGFALEAVSRFARRYGLGIDCRRSRRPTSRSELKWTSAECRRSTSETLTVMLFAIASVSLLVGGIGIMNILLVSVTERTKGDRCPHGGRRQTHSHS
ncbi:MAG: ABC transporter permease [Nitrospiraceae bacterium]